jgi:hypothetical protein
LRPGSRRLYSDNAAVGSFSGYRDANLVSVAYTMGIPLADVILAT